MNTLFNVGDEIILNADPLKASIFNKNIKFGAKGVIITVYQNNSYRVLFDGEGGYHENAWYLDEVNIISVNKKTTKHRNIVLFKDVVIADNLTYIEAITLLEKAIQSPVSKYYEFSLMKEDSDSTWKVQLKNKYLYNKFITNPESFVIKI